MRVEFNRYTPQKLFADIKKSIDRYEQLHESKADALRIGKVVLPNVLLPNGKTLDLNEFIKSKGGKIIGVRGAEIVGFLYRHPKQGKYKVLLHVPKIAYDVVRPTNSDRNFFIVERGQKIHLDERGMWES